MDSRMFCEIYRCEMSVTTCIQRQQNAKNHNKNWRQGIKPGALDINCQNCKQGKEIMEKYETEELANTDLKICKEKNCEFKGKPQPLSSFRVHAQSQKPIKICNSCMNKKISEGHKERKSRTEPLEKERKSRTEPLELTICFNQYPKIYEDVIALSNQKLRTPENQVLFILKKIYEQGLLDGKQD